MLDDDDDDFHTYYSDDPNDYDSDDDPVDEKTKAPEQANLEPPPPPYPYKLNVTSAGKNGQYTFDIQVISSQGRGIKSNIRIIEGDNRARTTKITNDDGFLEHRATPFKEEEREFLFFAIGTDLMLEVVLDGPEPPKPKPRKKIKPIPGGFWVNVRHAIAEYKKQQKEKENKL